MGAVLLRARADLRSHWRSWATLALLVGLLGGGVTAAAAGGRRTDRAFGRLLTDTRAPDAFAFSPNDDPSFAQIDLAQFLALPEVVGGTEAASFAVVDPPDVTLIASPDDRFGTTILRHKMLAGRPPRADRPDEAMVSFTLADAHHLRVGDSVTVSVTPNNGPGSSSGVVPVAFRVVGIEAAANEFPPQAGPGVNNVWATPAFFRANASSLSTYDTVMLQLRNGAGDIPALQADVRRLAAGRRAPVYASADLAVNVERSIHLQAVALWLLAALLALAGVLVVAQLLVRQSHLESGEYPTMHALGMSREQLAAVGMIRATVIGLLGAAVAVVVALCLSPLMPVGVARTAEPHPGFTADVPALALGALAVLSLVGMAGGWAAWRAVASAAAMQEAVPTGQTRRSRLADALSRGAAPVTATAGVRLALEPGRGRTAVPVRSTVTGAVIGVVALTAALGFSASLDHLLATPRLYGVTWDARITPVGSADVAPLLTAVRDDPAVMDVSAGYSDFPAAFGGVRVGGMAVEPERGPSLMPVPVEGRLPTGPDEIILGRSTMTALHAHIGSTVQGTIAEATTELVPLKVVGLAVFPTLSDSMGLGKGLGMTPDGVRHMIPGGDAPPADTILVRFHPGVDAVRATSDLHRRVSLMGAFTALRPARPVDLVNFGQVEALPLLLGGLLALFAAATLAHLLVTSIRRRRRDLAILRTLGLVPGQVRATVAWQSTTLSVVAVAVGIPVGVAAGRSTWLVFAHQLGITPEPSFPPLALAVLALATIFVANLLSVIPGQLAVRTSPAAVLRAE